MTDEIELLPLPEVAYVNDEGLWEERYGPYSREEMQDYARANVAVATAPLQAEIEALQKEVERLRTDLMESDEIREKLGHLLTRTAAALKGEPPEGVWHSWHDLPERAALAVRRADKLTDALREAREMVEDWAGYAGEYFQNKHDLQGDLAKLDAALREQEEGHEQ